MLEIFTKQFYIVYSDDIKIKKKKEFNHADAIFFSSLFIRLHFVAFIIIYICLFINLNIHHFWATKSRAEDKRKKNSKKFRTIVILELVDKIVVKTHTLPLMLTKALFFSDHFGFVLFTLSNLTCIYVDAYALKITIDLVRASKYTL